MTGRQVLLCGACVCVCVWPSLRVSATRPELQLCCSNQFGNLSSQLSCAKLVGGACLFVRE